MLNYASEAGEAGNGYTASFVAIFQDNPMIRSQNWTWGSKFSQHADIKGNYQHTKFGCPDS